LLKSELNSVKLPERKSAVKKVIAAMTVGKDVSKLFTDVLKCVETEDIELKKLVYLYIINYAKAQPDLALMAINTFRKDSTERANPLIRSLAVRTMGCVGSEQMLEYLISPLQDALNDEDPYVRKTSAICVAKVYEVNPQKVESVGLVAKLVDLLNDGNGMVVSNATTAVSEIQKMRGSKIVKINQ
jgi:AP-1 complex subunit beta-1